MFIMVSEICFSRSALHNMHSANDCVKQSKQIEDCAHINTILA